MGKARIGLSIGPFDIAAGTLDFAARNRRLE
jgi:hypothetical protein